MFYSQFILAKKGPLGTIWIAAHLERKLRKNQVADTDIGVSVDSIIFPEVPIALRLSSHLLLGVVRIYSRKVNYLFDDCSEALLKIKQAFRSTAVDLPPEESTAPYHSITLPETFDLDDFELPDQDIFQGHYVDHHISNKEQITLQDTMDGVVYSTSQFGHDERFGDGDSSQIGLDIEEDLLLNKLPAPENAGDGMDLDTSGHPDESIKSENNGDRSETSKAVQAKSTRPEVLNGNNESLDYAQAPATPGLVEEPNLSSQKTSACDDHFESKNHQLTEIATHENPTDMLHSSPHGEDMSVNHKHATIFSKENGSLSTLPNIEQSEPQEILCGNVEMVDNVPSLNTIGETCYLKNLSDEPCYNPGDLPETSHSSLSYDCLIEGQETIQRETLNNDVVACHVEQSLSPKKVFKSCGLRSQNGSDSPQVFQKCNSDVKMQDTLSNGKEDSVINALKVQEPKDTVILSGNFQVTGTNESIDSMNQSADTCQQVEANHSVLNKKTRTSVTKHGDGVSLSPSISELPAIEKLLSVPEGHAESPTDLLPDTTPVKIPPAMDEDGSGLITGHKRSFTESTITVDSVNTADSSGKDRLKKTAESIPDDEDLLSSILVGRRSSVLKLKPTPTQTEVVSMKRPRTATRSITYKRKVLMDDTMVLHGDLIREQLVSTEDIRRVRKKAPCTHHEIWMIQKQFLEEDIVYDPISTGMAMELVCLHNQAYELSEISITRVDESMNQMVSADGMQLPQENIVILDSQDHVVEENSKEAHLGTIFQIENQPGEGDTSCASHDNSNVRIGTSTALPLATSLEQGKGKVSEMEVDEESGAVVDAAAQASLHSVEYSSPSFLAKADVPETGVNLAVVLPDETNHINNETSSLYQSDIGQVDHSHVASIKNGVGSPLHVESGMPNELSLKEAQNGGSFEDIEISGPLVSPETYSHDLGLGTATRTFDNDGNNEAGPSFADGGQNAMLNEFDELQRQANGTTDTKDNCGTAYITTEHDTGFLNVDDDELEEDESYMPSVDESRTHTVDNSGWSTRSRAVGKYLQIMFDKEAGHGKKVISMDNLLTGKKRKEASRMFFETLVLKTKAYIQVEQSSPFDNINLCPQSMLMKSDF